MQLIPWSQLKDETSRPYFKDLLLFLESEIKKGNKTSPSLNKFFFALKKTSLEDTRVVFINSEPYSENSNGLAFGIQKKDKIPKTLENLNKELKSNLNKEIEDFSLESWASQGVLLLNLVLSTKLNQPKSHQNVGWEIFTDKLIKLINNKKEPVIFVFFGKDNFQKRNMITEPQHKVLLVHSPSFNPQGGFFGSNLFSKINELLEKPINW